MKTIGTVLTTAAAIAALFLMPLPGQAQGEKPSQAKAEPASKPVASAPKRTRANEDARVCLELATNMEIHKCAEKYR